MRESKQMKSIDLVRQFHVAFGQPILDTPSIANDAIKTLRIELLKEELRELEYALDTQNESGVLDALTDLQYVLDGAYLSLGFHKWKEAASAEFHRSNMSKLDENGAPVLREDGKILKGPKYLPPDLVTAMQSADKSDGWIDWKGGECPVEKCTIVIVRFRNLHECKAASEDLWVWTHEAQEDDIIAYRLA